ncbi:MAG: TonB-dependent receptor [Bacteroidota bacterium]|nr:TonB-dependent receptor [Bacteroidota bacterium]
MFRHLLAFILLLGCSFAAQNPARASVVRATDSLDAVISGYIKDSLSGETIIGATVRVRSLKRGAVTNKSGYYVLHLPSETELLLEVNSLGYRSEFHKIRLSSGEKLTLDFNLATESIQGGEITVETDKEKEEREAPQVSRVEIKPSQIASLPKAGESDIFRILQLIPGVQTISEISAGLYVRGGSPDQNLILLDGSVLYNPSHFFGFFSTFNSDAIKDVELIKGGYPAEYGGRLSAVLNVTDKDGDLYKTNGKITLGLISSRGTIETPIGDGALTLSGRRTYIDLILSGIGLQQSLDLPNYHFYDLNGKFTQTLGPYDKIAVSAYGGSDNLNFENGKAASSVEMDWGNQSGNASWTHLFSNELFMKLNLNTSHYFSVLNFGLGTNSFNFNNQIYDYTMHSDFEYSLGNQNNFKTGIQLSSYHFQLKITQGNNPPNSNIDLKPLYYAVYLSDEWKPDEKWAISPGLRVDGITTRPELGIDPRITIRYILSPDITLKASYGIYHQYLKLASNPLFSASDIWLPVDPTQAASVADQYVIGVSTAPWDGFTFDVETYYKNFTNLVELKPNVLGGSSLNDIFFLGNGFSYGIEFFLQKRVGNWTGWLGYTLAYTRRKFPDIDKGAVYPPTYDRRNDLNLVVTYKVNDRWTLGSTFVYATGQAYSQTTALYNAVEPDYSGKLIPIDGSMNGLRLEPYNRLDVSATYSCSFFSEKRNAELNFDIYNVYNHRNVWFRRIDTSVDPAVSEDIRLLPILPTFGFQIKF